MAESSKEDLVHLIKRFGAYLTLRISNLFPISSSLHNQNSHSIWALACFVIAIIFTWKILRAPSRHQRRRYRGQGPVPSVSGVNLQSNAVVPSTGIFSSSDDSKAHDVIDELFHPVKPTLGQIVRQKLNEGRKVTCRLLGVILEESSPEELQKHVTVRSSVLEILLEITKLCDLYLMERILDDESGEKILLTLEDAGLFTSGGLVKDKVLFCSTENGRSSFVRQVEPDWHIDTNPEIIFQLAFVDGGQLSDEWDCLFDRPSSVDNVPTVFLIRQSQPLKQWTVTCKSTISKKVLQCGSSNINFTFRPTDLNIQILMSSALQAWSSFLDAQIEINLYGNMKGTIRNGSTKIAEVKCQDGTIFVFPQLDDPSGKY